VIVLPNERTGLAALEEKLATQTLAEMLERTTKAKVNLHLPKFKVETTLDLEHHLSTVSIFYNKPIGYKKKIFLQMGLEQMFSDAADFSGISTTEPLKISKVVQKVYIEVSEEGTEAAAVTGTKHSIYILFLLLSTIIPPFNTSTTHCELIKI